MSDIATDENPLEIFKQSLRDRATKLEQKIQNWLQQPQKPGLRHQVEWESHKLMGAFETLALTQAADITRQIHTHLQASANPGKQAQLQPLFGSLQQAIDDLESFPNGSHTRSSQASCPRILMVDDDVMLLILLEKILAPWGLDVFTLSDPLQFWQTLEAAQPDLLILDVQMPEINGIELCQQVRDHDRWLWLPILFLTGQQDTHTVHQIFLAGADDYVNKPVLAPELIARLFNRLERFRLLNV